MATDTTYEQAKAALATAVSQAADSIGPALRAFEALITDEDEKATFADLHTRALDLLNEASDELEDQDGFETNEGGQKPPGGGG